MSILEGRWEHTHRTKYKDAILKTIYTHENATSTPEMDQKTKTVRYVKHRKMNAHGIFEISAWDYTHNSKL
jgi:hypothetical protein